MSEISAYEKMLEDGSAFQKVDMTMDMEPNLSEAQGMGERITTPQVSTVETHQSIQERSDDFTHHDNVMQQKINSLRSKMNGQGQIVSENTNLEIAKLKKKIKQIEEALMLIMETHEKLIG